MSPQLRVGVLVGLLAWWLALPALAHSLAFAYVRIEATDATHGTLTLKSPQISGQVPALQVRTPGCERQAHRVGRNPDGSVTDRWSLTCPDGIDAIAVGIEGLGGDVSEAVTMLRTADGQRYAAVLDGSEPRTLRDPNGRETGALSYLRLGAEHLLTGVDHLLFLLGLVLVVAGRRRVQGSPFLRPMLTTVTSFTVAHSLTLGLAALDLVAVPQGPVELLIAVSILLLAVELARHGDEADTLTYRRPEAVAFGFGLLHGFGFAGALGETGLPHDAIVPALLFFNLGIELGQLAVVAALVLLGVGLWRRGEAVQRGILRVSAEVLGLAAAFWTLGRAVNLLG